MSDLLSHPDDRLSALLDGELPLDEAAEVQAHVIACADCSAGLAAVRDARATLRSLPAVEPPAGFFEALLAGGLPDDGDEYDAPAEVIPISRTRRLVWANVAAAAVAGLMLAGAVGSTPADAVAPQLGGAAAQHSSSTAAMTVGIGSAGRSAADIAGAWSAPEELAGYRLVGADVGPDGVHLLYRKGPYGLSVFEQRGRLDHDELPPGGVLHDVAGTDAWSWRGRIVVLQRGGMVVTLVGDESPESLVAVAEALPGGPEPSPSWGERLRRACGDALEMLSPAS